MNFNKVAYWNDGRKGWCEYTDYNIKQMKGKPCKYYIPKKYNRKKQRNVVNSFATKLYNSMEDIDPEIGAVIENGLWNII